MPDAGDDPLDAVAGGPRSLKVSLLQDDGGSGAPRWSPLHEARIRWLLAAPGLTHGPRGSPSWIWSRFVLFAAAGNVVYLLAQLAWLAASSECDDVCFYTLLFARAASVLVSVLSVVSLVDVGRLARNNALAVLLAELSPGGVSQVAAFARRAAVWTWLLAAASWVVWVVQVVFISQHVDASASGPHDDDYTRYAVAFPAWTITLFSFTIPTGGLFGLVAMSTAVLWILVALRALGALWEDLGERVERATDPDEALAFYVQVSGHAHAQGAALQRPLAVIIATAVLASLAFVGCVVLQGESFDKSVRNGLLLNILFAAICAVLVRAVLRANAHPEQLMHRLTLARTFSPVERLAFERDIERIAALLSVYGVAIDNRVLAAVGLGLASSVAGWLVQLATGG